ncbi:MAG: ABC transporter permease subunit [Phycisphaerae bacterium]|nr:ABC transporter permease subunit [Phycisphaerae bacterium]
MVAIREDGTGALERVRRITPLGGGPSRAKLTHHDFPFEPRATGDRLPRWLFGTGDASMVLAVWEDGECRRFSIADPERPELIETVNLAAPGRRLTSVTMLVGAKTMIVGDDGGNLSGWFAARTPDTTNADRQRWVRAHDLGAMSGPVTSLYPSERDRNFVAADAGGTLRLLNMTSGKTVVEVSEGRLGAPRLAMIAPKGDGLAALGVSGTLTTWDVFAGHPEATMASLFGRVWYEGDPEPSHTYQSSSGDDAAEPKLGLAPLIWGTLKATIYTMVFAVPLAILAALCTSEFLDRRVRGAVKPLIEMMASLPSVVLGFVTAMLVAPFVKSHLSAVLSAFLTIPIGVLLCAHAWQAVPPRVARFVPLWARAALMATAFMFSATSAAWIGPTLERTLFAPSEAEVLVLAGSHEALPREQWPAWVGSRNDLTAIEGRRLQREGLFWRDGRVVRPKGSLTDPEVRAVVLRHSWDRGDLRQWLNGAYGGAWSGWLLLVFPGAAIFVSIAMGRRIASLARMTGLGDSHVGAAATEGIRLVFALVSAGALASVAASVLTACDLDTRDSIFGTFQQRNTLVVALAMSVAVIPIIYTICEDSMSAVPEGLRSASLAAGATRWQTAVRIVLPVAGSGVFSAVMIGLGRAAGETMVVLMATGNTPIMSASLFDGLRSLSANIAVELPEAAQGSTHYCVLFLCGLVLFVMTFAVNSLAEVVRQRFRRRSASL